MWTSTPSGDDGPGRVLPDGCMDLLWHDGRLLVAGPDTHAHVDGERPAPGPGSVSTPAPRPPCWACPPTHCVTAAWSWPTCGPAAEVRHATARVHAAHHPARGLEDVALRLAASAAPPDPLLTRLVAALDAGRPVAGTADELGLGARQLHRRSLTAFGYGPKTLARILRMRRALALARSGVPFAETAIRAGYADQPHLSREVRSLTGMALRELVPPGPPVRRACP